jgi:hypothetical protein
LDVIEIASFSHLEWAEEARNKLLYFCARPPLTPARGYVLTIIERKHSGNDWPYVKTATDSRG